MQHAMHTLYSEAQTLTTACVQRELRREEEERVAHEAAVAVAQERLLTHLLAGLEDRVREAAGQGRTEAELLEFNGNDTFDGEFCYLYLLKGPRGQKDRQGPGRAQDPSPRVWPLLRTLRTALAPFVVRHLWKTGTVQNSVAVSWA